ncbi:uncharacterized protein [Gossypium hirsutum]|uniref:Integrase catalytic domain-containing protein n=1 Tax=Gossypium hirsutum TaxID=3635 RepID=A0ABM2YPU3_GOSHI|nr:uncharacterized protein LOC121205024 [Gossypium hirsutum]
MDFILGLPLTPSKKDSIWVIVNQFSKSAHFLVVRTNYLLQKLAELHIPKNASVHGVPVSIISDKDPRFTSWFWKSLQKAFGSKLTFSTTYHLQTDGQSERHVVGPNLVHEIEEKVKLICERLKAATNRQKSYPDLKCRDIEFQVGDKVFLKVSHWKKALRFGKKGKLSPRHMNESALKKPNSMCVEAWDKFNELLVNLWCMMADRIKEVLDQAWDEFKDLSSMFMERNEFNVQHLSGCFVHGQDKFMDSIY